MRQHHPLGLSGAAGGILQKRRIIRLHLHRKKPGIGLPQLSRCNYRFQRIHLGMQQTCHDPCLGNGYQQP